MGRTRPGFTLTELLVAVVVFVGVLVATGLILATTRQVTATGIAAADVTQEASAIEHRLRADLARLAPEGVFVIRCVLVPNDLGGSLLDPNRPPDAVIRADQLLFFANGVEPGRTHRVGAGAVVKSEATTSCVSFGHAFTLAEAGTGVEFRPDVYAHDPSDLDLTPWWQGAVPTQLTRFETSDPDGTDMFESIPAGTITRARPLDARRWPLVRQAVLLVDDDQTSAMSNRKTVYLGGPEQSGLTSGRSLWRRDPELGVQPQVYHGRVAAAATELDEVRRLIGLTAGGVRRPWSGVGGSASQRDVIAALLHYPRAERAAPSMHRVDESLTSHVLAAGCSSVVIDWTYADGVGEVTNRAGHVNFPGVRTQEDAAHPWFGPAASERDVAMYGALPRTTQASTIFPGAVERTWNDGPITVYEAIFGFNQDTPLDRNGQPSPAVGYTPWPTSIRVTLTLHDARAELEVGRTVQFVIDLPRRGGGAS